MKKNFIKVSVICALTLASSATMVSCSDYDDDIKNHQEQIDALKKQLDASKTEITEGLNTAIEGLEAEIKNIAGSKADAASVKALEQKAAELQEAINSKASNEQITALADEVKGLINDVNTELSAAMEGTKTELQGQISTLEQKQEDLQKELATLTSSSNTANQKISALESQLQDVKDDLKNAQSKHDALESSVTDLKNLLNTEIASLTNKQNELSKQIANCSSKEEVAALQTELADVKEDLGTAKDELKLLNTNVASLKTNLEKQISELTSELATTNKNWEAAVAAQDAKVEGVKSQLNDVNEEMLSISDRLQVIEEGNFGQRITTLEQQIVDANKLIDEVKQKSESEIARLDEELTAEIKKAISDAKAEISADYGSKIDNLDKKFSAYITVNDFDEKVETLMGLISDNRDLIDGLIEDKIDPTDYKSLKEKVDSIYAMVIENGDIDQRIAESINDLKTELKGVLGNMIQSVTYVPSYYTDGGIVPVGFSTLQITKEGKTPVTAENINDEITLRVTPASAAEDFANKYNVVFEGNEVSPISRAGEESPLTITNVQVEEGGIVKLSVTRNKNKFADGKYYNLCAHIYSKETGSNPTNISSNYFLAKHENLVVKAADLTVTTSSKDDSFVWNETGKKVTVAQNVTITDGASGTDLVKEFGNIFTVSYSMYKGNNSPFKVDPSTGYVQLKAAASDMIGVSDYVVATVYPTGYADYSGTSHLSTFTVVKQQIVYNAAPITPKWSAVAAGATKYTFPLNEIARTFGVSIDDAAALIKKANETSGAVNQPSYSKISIEGDNLIVTFNQNAKVQEGQSIVINMKDNTSSVTQSATEYQINIQINPLQYTSVALPTPQKELWDAAQEKVIISPKVTRDASNKISGMTLGISDITTIYSNLGDVEDKAAAAGAVVSIETTNKPAGVSRLIDYVTNGANNKKSLLITANNYQGGVIKGSTSIKYTNGANGPSKDFSIEVLNISGTFTAPAEGTRILQMPSKNGSVNISSLTNGNILKWTDYLGNTIWKNGSVVTDAFASDPFSMYAMSKPTFEMNDKFLKLSNGTITLNADGKDYNFTQNYEATLQVKIAKPRWGEIQGLDSSKIVDGYYVLNYKVLIPAGIK